MEMSGLLKTVLTLLLVSFPGLGINKFSQEIQSFLK
jgi:hypothetical protein